MPDRHARTAFPGNPRRLFLFRRNKGELYVTADANNFLLVFPEGTGALGGPPLFKLQTWNSGNFDSWPQQHGIDDVLFVRDMVAALGTEWNVDMNHNIRNGTTFHENRFFKIPLDINSN